MIQLTSNNRANGNGSDEYQPSEVYEHLETDLWAKENKETGEAEFTYELLKKFEDEDDQAADN